MATAVLTLTDKEGEPGKVKVRVEFSGEGLDKSSPAHIAMIEAAQRLVGDQEPEFE